MHLNCTYFELCALGEESGNEAVVSILQNLTVAKKKKKKNTLY